MPRNMFVGHYTSTEYVEWRASILMNEGVDSRNAYLIANREADKLIEKANKISNERRIIMKARVFKHYGNICECCGEDREHLLTVDHIEGGVTQHQRKLQKDGRGITIYDWLVGHDYPEGFRIFCYNCNMSYGFYGYCPHRDEPFKLNKRQIYRRKRRIKAIVEYGGECMICGENRYEFLCFHHDGGWQLYTNVRFTGNALVSWLLKRNIIEGIKLLCNNCHMDVHRANKIG